MNTMQFNTKLSGEYRLVITSNNGEVKDTGWFSNLILNQGLDKLGNATDIPFKYASIGTGTSAPIITQTSLDAPVAYSNSYVFVSAVNAGSPSYATTLTWSYTFTQGAVIGNMTEIGVGITASNGNLFSRALILDSGSNPTTITLTAIDQLTIYYRLTVRPPLTDGTGSIILDSNTYNYTSRVLGANTFADLSRTFEFGFFHLIFRSYTYAAGATLAPITATSPVGTNTAINNGTVNTLGYTVGNYYIDWNTQWSPLQGNETGGIQAIKITAGSDLETISFQIVFNQPIPKTNVTSLSLTFRYSWSR